jgi:trigger factor
MNVSIETMTGLERRLTIALPSEDFESQITERLEDARGKVSLPGFRPGKVPLREVRRRFGNSVRAEVAGELMQASFFDAVQQEELNPAGSPNLEVVKMDPGIDFEFTATFEVFPSIDIADLGKVLVKKPATTITDDDLEAMIQRLREQRTTFVDVERAAASGDQVKADFAATLNGEPVAGTEGQDVEFRLGQGQMIEDFDQGVIGMSAGETKSFPATFPEDYRAENLKGETVEFTVTVKAVTEPQLPELNDEFFEGFGVTEGGEAAFREEVKSNMQRELDSAINNQLKQQVMDSLATLHEFQLPQAIVHREIHVLKEQMFSQFQMGGRGQQLPDLPDELFTDQAQRRVKVGLVVNEIIRKADIEADPELVEAKLQEIAAPYGEPEQVIAYYRSNAEQMQSIEMGVLEDQVVDHIIKAAQVQIVEASYDDVLSGKAIADPEASADDAADDDDDGKTTATGD